MRILLVGLLLMVMLSSAASREPHLEYIKIVGAGIYEVEAMGRHGGSGEGWEKVRRGKQVQQTGTIPAELCLSFGVEYMLIGHPPGARIPIRMVTRFPKGGLQRPGGKGAADTSGAVFDLAMGPVHFRSYTFDEHWELVPGSWTFEFWHGHRQLAAYEFKVVAAQGTAPRKGCQNPIASLPNGSRLAARSDASGTLY